jgi:DNA ligase-1
MESNELLFVRLRNFLIAATASNSLIVKRKVVEGCPNLIKLFNYVYDPFKKYHVTVKQLVKHADIITDEHIEKDCCIYDLLDMLASREITGHAAIGTVNYFISNNEEHADLIKLIIGKDLKCRVGASIINDIFPGTIPQFKVALAKEYEDSMAPKMDWPDWLVMRKLDGVRCVIKIDGDSNARFFSRKGHEFHTLDVVAEEIKSFGVTDLVLDGEVCLIDENGKEDFQTTVGLVKRKDYTIPAPKFIVFDVLTHEEFDAEYSEESYIDRLLRYCPENRLWHSADTMSLIDAVLLEDEEDFKTQRSRVALAGWEGLILRRASSPYEGKRTKNLLKVKFFKDAEYEIQGYEVGPFRVISKDTGLEEEIITLTNVLISHKENVVSVGSGFSIEERKHYFKHPEELVGKQITVKYFEETTNKDGGISLRFPTVKKIWKEGKRDI